MDEITLTHAGWAWKSKISFFVISAAQKFTAYTNIQIHVMRSILIFFFFLNARNNALYQNQ